MFQTLSRVKRRPWSSGVKTTLVWLMLCFLPFPVIAASGPVRTVEEGTEKVLGFLQDQDMDKETRRAHIRDVVDEHFDFQEMAMRALGPHWREQPSEKQEEYVSAFSDFLFGVYIDRIERYSDETVTYELGEEREAHALVQAIIKGKEVGEIPVEYRLRLTDEEWRVYDVVIEGVSLVNNYRSQFNDFLARNTFDDLLSRLKERSL